MIKFPKNSDSPIDQTGAKAQIVIASIVRLKPHSSTVVLTVYRFP